MRRIYVRIYLTVLGSVVVFAVAIALVWRHQPQVGPASYAYEFAADLARSQLPSGAAPLAEQRAALAGLATALGTDVSLFAPDRALVAAHGVALPPPVGRGRPGWIENVGGVAAWSLELADGRWLVVRVPAEQRQRAYGALLALAALALAVALGAYPVARRIAARLERLQLGVEALGQGDLEARVPVEGRDEVARVAQSFNRAADRIAGLVAAHKTLLANASHELRTPLARIRMGIELQRDHVDPARLRQIEEDIGELDQLIDEILLASRLDAVADGDTSEPIDLLALVAEECARYVRCTLDGELAWVRGDARLLRRAIRNLLDNATRHAPGSPVEVRVRAPRDGWTELSVRDHGPGIAEADRDRVFEPFYRGRAAGGSTTGSGLGLALVQTIARRLGGDARCAVPAEGSGALMILRLPAYADDSS